MRYEIIIKTKKKKKAVEHQELLTGLALIDLNVGTIKTVTAKKVRVSNPKSLMTSTAPATSYATHVCSRSHRSALLYLEKQDPFQPENEGTSRGALLVKFCDTVAPLLL